MLTFKDSLRLTVGTGNVSTSGTFLAGITSINILDLHPLINTLNIFVKRKSAEATRLKARVSALLLQETRK